MRKVINQGGLRQWAAAGGAFCFLAGISAPLLGLLLTTSGWVLGVAVHPWLHVAGTALFIVAIPLILFAGFCLDWAERQQERTTHDAAGPSPDAEALPKVAFVASLLGASRAGPHRASCATDHRQLSQHRDVPTWQNR